MAKVAEGRPAPALALPEASGRRVSLADFRGRDVIVYSYPREI
jgi:peroxiredoxin Q/BCP